MRLSDYQEVSNNVGLCLTPTITSWAKPIEAQFGSLRTFTPSHSNHLDHTVFACGPQAYLRWRNAMPATPTSWPPNDANEPASAADDTNVGADHSSPDNPVNPSGQRSSEGQDGFSSGF